MKTYRIKLPDCETPSTIQALNVGKALTSVVGERLRPSEYGLHAES
jgi:hypothetical protein